MLDESFPKKASQLGRCLGIGLFCWSCTIGCAAAPYRYSHFHGTDDTTKEVVVEYGKPQKTLDRIAYLTGFWSRILPLSNKVNNHSFSDETKMKLFAYMEENDLNDVLVRVNQYDPRGEWRRLRENHRVSPGWRYTVGIVSIAHYTLLPGRVFGGDQYNGFTNSLSINSDVLAVVLHEAAYAKDIHSRSMPGSYAFVNQIPFVSLWRHTKGVNDVLGYALTTDDWALERETYRVVYPQMGVHSTMIASPFVPFWDGLLLSVVGAGAGHASGQMAILRRTKERNAQGSDVSQPDTENEPTEEFVMRSRKTRSTDEIQPVSHQIDVDD